MRLALVLVGAIAMGSMVGCGTTGARTLSGAEPRYELNKPKMSAVERQAQMRGVKTRWVNPPKIKVADDGQG
ncbi:MAG: hypothetical protein KDI71_07175 [Xanthomonadales bacterium]|nr:hypothetical protein [Xanthomonadales bacterium]